MFIRAVILAYTISLFLVLVVLAVALLYNRLVGLRNRLRNAFSQIDVQLKRRHDLIANLAETARGYLHHERELLESLAAARSQADASVNAANTSADTLRSLGESENVLTSALGRLLAVVEAYPDLKANQTLLALMEELTTTENRVAFARQAYNDSAMFYNTAIQTIPSNLLAGPFGFQSVGFFEMDNPADRDVPRVFEVAP